MRKGLFITLEGGEGCGKTTAATAVCQKLAEEGYDVLYTREPGGVDIAEQIRKVILDVNNTAMDSRTEALLYAASRRQHLIEKVIPALKEKRIVICDRFVDSSLVYQGYARGIGIEDIWNINLFAIDDYMPDLTLFFDVSVEEGLNRIAHRDKRDRLDVEGLAFHHRVYEGYKLISEMYPDRIVSVDASKSIEEVFRQTYELIIGKIRENEDQ
ncbi:MAG: dTMP kinase [Erysipelotrichaceae bacterium]|nr:dTMP kinase [Erysipelotrichaceae bacterium]